MGITIDDQGEEIRSAGCVCGHDWEDHILNMDSGYSTCATNCGCSDYQPNLCDEIISSNGGKRQRLNLRFDKLPGGYTSLVWIARIAEYGNIVKNLEGDYDNWKRCDPHSEQSPLNHAIGHALEAAELEYGSLDRVWVLAKAAWNLLAQIWFEIEDARDGRTKSFDVLVEEWFSKKCAPTTFRNR